MAATPSASARPAQRDVPAALFDALFDDAAIFPPGNAPMRAAVAAHVQVRRSPAARHVGPFLCSAARLGELAEVLDGLPAGRLDVSLVVQEGADALAAAVRRVTDDDRLELRGVELPAAPAGLPETLRAVAAAVPDGVPAYLEVPLGPEVGTAVGQIAAAGRRAKFRTGGATPAAFPGVPELVAGLAACARHGVPFKLTAGLHHAVRHRDPATGFEHHGFLNVLAAVAAEEPAADLLGLTEPGPLVAAVRGLDAAARARSRFVAFGTCSTAEPLDDLRDLGLLPEEER